jgi:hypothetical protein
MYPPIEGPNTMDRLEEAERIRKERQNGIPEGATIQNMEETNNKL